MNKETKRTILLFAATLTVLLVPFIAMQFTSEVNWSPGDFLVAGVLLFGAALLADLALRKIRSKGKRMAVVAIIMMALILVWIELAVGIFGTPFAGS
ncbi:MAG: hypothetical protein U0289_14090 [Cyclobacteriaceae bacterium]|jgi:uncharacterized membrane protein|nr:hypothetical protein [Cyclobacteriaceae bacterium]